MKLTDEQQQEIEDLRRQIKDLKDFEAAAINYLDFWHKKSEEAERYQALADTIDAWRVRDHLVMNKALASLPPEHRRAFREEVAKAAPKVAEDFGANATNETDHLGSTRWEPFASFPLEEYLERYAGQQHRRRFQ